MTYDAVVSTERSHQFDDFLSGIRGFDAVTVDPSSSSRAKELGVCICN